MLDFFYKVMKLKLEFPDHGAVLSVTESISSDQVSILKAGLGKIFARVPGKTVLLDLTAVDGTIQSPISDSLLELKRWALVEAERPLLIVSAHAGTGDAPSLAEALRIAGTEAELESALCRVGESVIRGLEARRDQLAAELKARDKLPYPLRQLRTETSRLRQRIRASEQGLSALDAAFAGGKPDRVADPRLADAAARRRTAERVIEDVLARQGLLA